MRSLRDSEHRTLSVYRREVAILLVHKHRLSSERAARLLGRWDAYVSARWRANKPPCVVADHLARWDKEGVVCPCSSSGRDPSCPKHGRRSKRGFTRRDTGRRLQFFLWKDLSQEYPWTLLMSGSPPSRNVFSNKRAAMIAYEQLRSQMRSRGFKAVLHSRKPWSGEAEIW